MKVATTASLFYCSNVHLLLSLSSSSLASQTDTKKLHKTTLIHQKKPHLWAKQCADTNTLPCSIQSFENSAWNLSHKLRISVVVVSTVASQREGSRFNSQLGPFCVCVCMFSPCTRGFSPGTVQKHGVSKIVLRSEGVCGCLSLCGPVMDWRPVQCVRSIFVHLLTRPELYSVQSLSLPKPF